VSFVSQHKKSNSAYTAPFSFTSQNSPLSSIVNHLQQYQYSRLFIHVHLQSIDDEKHSLPSNILILPFKHSCFCYQNIIS
jgi:hypothetical protein